MNEIPELDLTVHHPHPLPSREGFLEQICSKFYPYLMKNIVTISKPFL